ncbi:MAG: MotA/TolQ/ExbB proton channel family protein [Thermodesulfobacteriota bacterium]
MDIATLVGIVLGLGLIVGAIMFGGGALGGFIDIPSVLVVIGGSMAAILVMFPLGVVLKSFSVAMKAFVAKQHQPQDLIEQMVALAQKARKESLVALGKAEIEDPFVKKGIMLVADGTQELLVRSVLETEIAFMKQRHRKGQDVMKGLGTMAPAFGMIGTLIGLVQMLQNLNDPSSIGPAMAVALLTTFYGAVLSNLIFLPMAKKLEDRSGDEALYMELAMEGVLSIQNGDHPALLKEKLMAFLAPAMRGKK